MRTKEILSICFPSEYRYRKVGTRISKELITLIATIGETLK